MDASSRVSTRFVPGSKEDAVTAQPELTRQSQELTRHADARRWLLVTAVLLWIETWIGTLVAVHKKLPYGLGGHGHPNDVWGDFVSGGGTALSPPLVIVIVFAVLIVLATRRGWVGVVGAVGLALLGLLSVATIIGEPLARRVLTPSHVAFPETALVVVSLVGAALMVLFAVWHLASLYRGGAVLSRS